MLIEPGTMIDIETMSHRPNASILALGAVRFDKYIEIKDRFYCTISMHSNESHGLDFSARTIQWWFNKSQEARDELLTNTVCLGMALGSLRSFLTRKDDLPVWANSPSFDLVILKNAFTATQTECPWRYSAERDYRTIKNLCPEITTDRQGTHHNALDDALHQTAHLKKCLQHLQN